MTTKTIQILAVAIALILAGGAYLAYTNLSNSNELDLTKGITFGDSILETIPSDYSLDKKIDNNPLYKDAQGKFSFSYPEGFSVGNFGDATEAGETILIQRQGEKAGFQVFVALFDEPGTALTPERITEDVPGIVMQSPEPVELDGQVIGISFTSENSSFGPSREVWIAKGGYIYQMTSYLNDQVLLKQVLSTWKFLK